MIHHYKRVLLLFIILIGMIPETPVFAEGSKDFYPAGASGSRAILISATAPLGSGYVTSLSYPFLTRAEHFAYVKEGESIAAASSGQNRGNGRIILTAPNGAVYTSTNDNVGQIGTRTAELSGSRIGYTPFQRVATAEEEGVWKIEFTAPGAGDANPQDITATTAWTQSSSTLTITAWDVSVFGDAVTTVPTTGRVYANVLNLAMPQNWTAGRGFYGKHYVLTKDGYAYLVDENGANGAAYTFFVNSKGFTTAAGGAGTPTYKSLNSSTVNVFVKDPRNADDANGVTHKIFYNKPDDPNLPVEANFAEGGTTWLKPASVVVPTVSNIVFEGVENSGSSVSSKGANIKFESNVNGTYKIVIPGNGSFNDRVLTGTTVVGSNTVVWDGAAGLSVADPVSPGAKVPPGTVLNQVKVQLFGAEVHFPFVDVEINPNGLIIEQLTTDGTYTPVAGGDVVYWDDSNITNAGTPPNPKKAVLGISSISSNINGHKWGANPGAGGNDYGNTKSLDTYTFVPGAEIIKNITVTIEQADLEVTSISPSVTTQTVGNTITYTVLIKNLNIPGVSVSDVNGAVFGFEYSTGFTVNSAVLTVNNGTIVESSPTTTTTKFSATLSMTSGSEATYVITGTVGAALKNTTFIPRATILRPADVADPNATDESTPTFSNSVDTECNGNPSGAGCNNILSPNGVTITNVPPVANPDANSTDMNTTLTVADGAPGDILLNDTDADGDPLLVTKFTVAGSVGDKTLGGAGFLIPGQGTITINANGSYSFVPLTNFTGAVNAITYTLSDGTATTTTTLNITVNSTNSAPAGVANTNTVAEDVTLTVTDGAAGVTGDLLVNDTDPENDVLTITKFTVNGIVGDQAVATPFLIPAVGTITINANGSYTFVPVANYYGAVPQIIYTLSDGALTATATLDITVTPVNDVPVLLANTNTVAEDATLTVADGAPGVTGDILVNDSDIEGNTLTVTKFTVNGIVGDQAVTTPFLIPSVGTITINANGSYTFVPLANYNGNVPQITYTATDGTATATSTLDITVTHVNDAPVAVNNTGNTDEDVTLTVADGAIGIAGDVLVNDSDVDGNTLTVATYTIAGVAGTQAVAAPVLITGVGTITLNANGSYTFAPVANYNGAVPIITYTVTDGTADATATLTITINPINDAPVLAANTNTVAEDVTLTVPDGATGLAGDLLVNDSDVDGNILTVANFSIAGIAGTQAVGTPVLIPSVGTITISANGSYAFVPVANYNGNVPQVTYTATDGTATATSTLDITVTPVNDAPVAVANTNITLEDTSLNVVDGTTGVTGDILVNDSDSENDVLTVAGYTIAGVAGNQTVGTPLIINGVGTIRINGDGSYAFQPALNFNGPVPIVTYTVSDGNTGTTTSTLTISVTPVNDRPAFTKGADQIATIGATTQTVNAWATAISKGPANENAQNVDFIVTNDKNTLFTTQPAIDPAGVLTYTPAPGQYGKAAVTVYIHDDGGTTNGGVDQSATQTFVISIKPVGTSDTDVTPLNTSTMTVVTANDGASGVGTSVIPGGTSPANGSITINPDRSITYTPNNGFVGTDTYTYILETPDGIKSDPVTVTVTVYDPKITLAKEGNYNDFNANGKVDAGDRINYTFVVTNAGTVPVTNITITDANATIAGGPIASLAVAGIDNSTFTGFHTLTQAEINNGGVFNSATATGKDPKNNDVTVISNDPTPLDPSDPNYPVTPPTPACPSCTVTPIVQTGSMTLAKEGVYNDTNADGKVNVGDRINYTFVVTNTGNITLANVMVTDPGAVITGGPLVTLAAGTSNNSTFTAYHILTQADIDNGGVFNTATAKAEDPKGKDITTTSNDPTPLDPTDPNYPVTPPTPACPTCTVTPIPQNGSMSVAKDGVYNDANNDGKVNVGDRINYTFTITNTGNVTLTNIMVTDANAVVNGGPITTLAVGASNSTMFTAYHILTQADIDNGGVFNSAIAKGKDPKNNEITTISNDPTPLDPTDPNHPVTPPTPACPTCTVTPIVQTGSMTLLKDGIYNDANNDGKVNVGDRINYTFTVTNTGNVTLTNISIADANATMSGGPLASLSPGTSNSTTFTGYHVLTQADIDNRGVFNTATATGKNPRNQTIIVNSVDPTPSVPGAPDYPVNPPTPACPTCTVTPIVQNGSVALVKTVTNNGNGAAGTFVLGDAIQYTFTITNTGNVTLSNITVTDAKLGTGTITIPGTLAPNAVATIVRTYTVTAADIAVGNVTNTAVVDAKDPANNPVTDISGSTSANNNPTVTTLAKPPVANNDVATTRQNDPVVVTVVANDDPGSTPVVPATVSITATPTHGIIKVNADGTVTYTPNPGYTGADFFTYTVKDANGQTSNPAVVNLTVVPSNPKATNDDAKTTFSSPVTIPVLSNDVKDGADFNLSSIEIVGQPLHGAVKSNADGTITYTPRDGYTGTETFTYRVKDQYGNWTNAATVTVLVEGTFIPNVITPDGDGKNDFFVIVGLQNYDRVEVEVYNRWGNQVYINKDYKNDWSGERLNEGTYYYNIRLKKGSVITVQKGWILIKR